MARANSAVGSRTTNATTTGRSGIVPEPWTWSLHIIRGVAQSRLGPDLTNVGARRTIGAGTLPGGIGSIAGWIASAQHLKPGNAMQSYDRLEGGLNCVLSPSIWSH